MEYLKEYLRYLGSKGYTDGTISAYETTLRQLGFFIQKQEQQISGQDIQSWHRHLKTLPIHKSTVAIKLKSVKRYFSYLIKRQHLLMDPSRDEEIVYEKEGLIKEILTLSEITLLLDSPSKGIIGIRDKAVMEVLYSTGIRGCELCALDVQDINLKENEIHIKDLKTRTERRLPLARKSKAVLRQYFLTGREALSRRERIESAVFLNRFGRRLNKQWIQSIIKKHIKRSGIQKHITPHCLRHSCATHMLQNGAPLKIIQQMLGHKSLRSTEIYTRVLKAEMKPSKPRRDKKKFKRHG